LDVDLAANTYQFSVDGQDGFAVPQPLVGPTGDARYLIFATGGGTNGVSKYFVDAVPAAVPEPVSGLSTLIVAGLALTRVRRR
jgi:hypothetical protein